MSSIEKNTSIVKSLANDLGFDYCGIAKAEPLPDDAKKLESWLNAGMHGEMRYMENHFDLRVDPSKLVPGAKSVITLLVNYFPSLTQDAQNPQISKYAYGHDYHEVIRARLKMFLSGLRDEVGAIHGRGFVDSAPVLERAWAEKSGLGWVGKNGNFITKQQGSYFFIATLITDIVLKPDDPFGRDYCGTCTKCIEACPTDAILPDKVINGSQCISYFTIELKSMLIPENVKGKFENHLFGCDVCQDVCPWNRFSKPHAMPEFEPLPAVLNFSTSDWEELTEESFKTIFKDSPIKRSKFEGIKRNLSFLSHN